MVSSGQNLRVASVYQPSYIPYLGYFQRLAASDVHVVYDHVLFDRYWFMHRNKIRTAGGWIWLTVPIKSGKGSQLKITDAKIDNSRDWRSDHLGKIKKWYSRSEYFDTYYPMLEMFYEHGDWETLVDVTGQFRDIVCTLLGIEVEICNSSELGITKQSSQGILETCTKVGANEYLSGPFGPDYLDIGLFTRAGIVVKIHKFEPTPYKQAYRGFEPNMSIIDALFNVGLERTRTLVGSSHGHISDCSPS